MTMRQEENIANELWFLEESFASVASGALMTSVRLGDRCKGTEDAKGSYIPGRLVRLRFHDGHGTFKETQIPALITSAACSTVGTVALSSLKGSDMAVSSREELRSRLAALYQRDITDNEEVAVVTWKNIVRVEDLIFHGAARIAAQPRDNASDFTSEGYTIPLIAHDYPALTAAMWNAAYTAFGMKVSNTMLVIHPDSIGEVLMVLKYDPRYMGGGIGVGLKEFATQYVDILDPLARAIGAINFVKRTSAVKLAGYNTDGEGFAVSLEKVFAEKGKKLAGAKAVLIGAGGTANAVAFALASRGMRITIVNRTLAKAEDLAKRINDYHQLAGNAVVRAADEYQMTSAIVNADAIINVSTKGTAGELERFNALAPATAPYAPTMLAENAKQAARAYFSLRPDVIISDIVLAADDTPFIQGAKVHGLTVLNGVPMVVYQGVAAFFLAHGDYLFSHGIRNDDVTAVMAKAAGCTL